MNDPYWKKDLEYIAAEIAAIHRRVSYEVDRADEYALRRLESSANKALEETCGWEIHDAAQIALRCIKMRRQRESW